jgi:dephospho-CoA kinase
MQQEIGNLDLRRVVVLTGSIGSGKSTVAQILAEHGAKIVSADELARLVVEPGTPGLAAVVAAFGESVLNSDGSLNRSALGQQIFADSAERRRLEEILHPRIAELSNRQISELQAQKHELIVYDCPLFFEAGLSNRGYGIVLVVSAPAELRKKRISSRDHLPISEIENRMASQIDDEYKKQHATLILENDGTIEQLRKKIEATIPKILTLLGSAS